MKKYIAILPLLITSISFAQVINKDIEIIEDFQSVNVNARYTVYIKQSNETKIEVKALKEVMDISSFKIENGVLNINIKRDNKDKSIWEEIDDIKIAPKLDIYISMKNVKALSVNGSGKIITQNSISSEDLSLTVAGSGSIEADVKGNVLNINHAGSGLMKLKGYANDVTLNMSGYGKIESYGLQVKNMTAKLTGSGDVEAFVSDNMNATVYGRGTIKFKGDTKELTKNEYGQGKVERTY
jgi:hypothetical protein